MYKCLSELLTHTEKMNILANLVLSLVHDDIQHDLSLQLSYTAS